MKRFAWTFLLVLLLSTYYLSSIPGLRVLPVLKQVHAILLSIDVSIAALARVISSSLPAELGPARVLLGDFYAYARQNPELVEYMLRKSAHVGLFFLLTLAFFLVFRLYTKKPFRALLGSFLAGISIAILDEYHQSFVPGRVGSLIDVAIDTAGVFLAAAFIAAAFLLNPSRPDN